MKKVIILSILALATIGCKPKQTTTTTVKEVKEVTELTVDEPRDTTSLLPISVSEMNNMKETGDFYTIKSAKISDNVLWLQVSYGGGCKEHQFEMLFNNAYMEAKSEEISGFTEIKLTLHHNGNNDACRSIVQENIRFNLVSVQDKGINKLRIQLSGWEGYLDYSY